MVSRRSRWMTGCLLAAGLAAWGGAAAAEPSPEEVLKSRGLSKSGLYYVLADPEADFFKELDAVEPYFARLQEGRRNILAVAENDSRVLVGERRMSELNASINLLDRTIRGFGRKNTFGKQDLVAERAMLVQERAALRPQLDAARGARISPAQRREMFGDFEKMRTEFRDKARTVSPAGERVQSQYTKLANDEAIRAAIKDVGRAAKTRIELGPSPRFKAAYRGFQAAVSGAKSPDELMKEDSSKRKADGPAATKGKRAKAR